MKSKYIVFEVNGLETIVLFEVVVKHSEVSIQWGKPVSAGFFTEDGQCYGHSESLKLDSRGEEDSRLLKRLKEGL